MGCTARKKRGGEEHDGGGGKEGEGEGGGAMHRQREGRHRSEQQQRTGVRHVTAGFANTESVAIIRYEWGSTVSEHRRQQ